MGCSRAWSVLEVTGASASASYREVQLVLLKIMFQPIEVSWTGTTMAAR
jgi:hypothetical protein